MNKEKNELLQRELLEKHNFSLYSVKIPETIKDQGLYFFTKILTPRLSGWTREFLNRF